MLRRTSESQWFNGPIIELTEHKSHNMTVAVPEEHRQALNRLKDIDKQKEAKAKREWEEKYPGQPYSTPLNQYFKWSYKQTAVATIPGLATLLERIEALDGPQYLCFGERARESCGPGVKRSCLYEDRLTSAVLLLYSPSTNTWIALVLLNLAVPNLLEELIVYYQLTSLDLTSLSPSSPSYNALPAYPEPATSVTTLPAIPVATMP